MNHDVESTYRSPLVQLAMTRGQNYVQNEAQLRNLGIAAKDTLTDRKMQ